MEEEKSKIRKEYWFKYHDNKFYLDMFQYESSFNNVGLMTLWFSMPGKMVFLRFEGRGVKTWKSI